MAATIAITGATGFAGRHTVAELVKRGHQIRALVRKPAQAALPDAVKLVPGDLSDQAALKRLIEGVDAIVHLAGVISAIRREEFENANIKGAETIARLAAAAGVSRFIHISSLAAREPQLSAYGASKRAGEQVVQSHYQPANLLIIRPPVIYGPGDPASFPLLKALTGRTAIVPGRPSMRFSLLHVHDFARLVANSINSATAGIVEVSDGKSNGYSWNELAEIASRTLGHPVRPVYLPKAIPAALAPLAELTARLAGRPFMLNRGKVAELYHSDWVVRSNGLPLYSPIQFDKGFGETLAWYRAEGWLPASRAADKSGGTH